MPKLQVNKVFRHLEQSTKRITIEQGGTRSGKTYNILIWIIVGYCLRHKGKTITLCRKTYPALRASAMRDFFEILDKLGLYDANRHNKSNGEYWLNGNLIEFIGADQPQKIRGRKRSLLFANEANELHEEDWKQLVMRTEDKIIIDYNPSMEYHWIYDKVIPRDDAEFHQTTYLDNPFLPKSLIEEIELLKTTDPDYWRVYGLGERGVSRSLVFNYRPIKDIPYDEDEDSNPELICYGLDFGFAQDATAVVAIWKLDRTIYVDEILYEAGLTGHDIAKRLKDGEIDKSAYIYCDTGGGGVVAIEEMRREGLKVRKAKKGQGSVADGIDLVRQHEILITERSINVIKEIRNYKYKQDRQGNILNTPADGNDHAMDAMRYGIYSVLRNPNRGRYAIR